MLLLELELMLESRRVTAERLSCKRLRISRYGRKELLLRVLLLRSC